MKKFKYIAFALSLLLIVGVFTGCSSDDSISDSIDESRAYLTIGFDGGEGAVKLNGEEVSAGEEIKVAIGEKLDIEAVPNENYIFNEWQGLDGEKDNKLLEGYKVTEDIELIASFFEAGYVEGYVTDGRGGPGIEGATVLSPNNQTTTSEDGYFSLGVKADEVADLFVEKEERGIVRIQNVEVEQGERVEFELPSRSSFNPDWSDSPPEIEVTGVERGQEVSGELEISFEVTGERPTFVYYVNFGGLQRGPEREAFGIDVDDGQAIIDTTKHPNGKSFIRILAYDDNSSTVMKVIPVEVFNEPGEGEAPGEMNWMGLTSISTGQNIGFFSNEIEALNLDDNRDISGNIYETPEGNRIDISNIPDDSTLYNEVKWGPVAGADGYSVYRSFDGDDFKHIGNITQYQDKSGEDEEEFLVGQYNDYSPELRFEEIYYKVVPYNANGEGEPAIRTVEPLAPFNVVPVSPENEEDNVKLNPEFSWEIDIKGEWDQEVNVISAISLFDATDWLVFQDVVINELQYSLDNTDEVDELAPNTVYSWDIFYSEAFAYEEDMKGYSEAVAIAGGQRGSLIGENIFTTLIEKPGEETPDELKEIFSYESLYNESEQDTVLIKASDINDLDSLVNDLGSDVLITWEEIDWAKVSVPAGLRLPEFIGELNSLDGVIMAQPNLRQELPYHEKVSEDLLQDYSNELTATGEIGADDYEKYLWGMNNINAEGAWDITTGNDDVVVAIVDTGVAMDHPEFANNDFVAPLNATGDDGPGAFDFQGHGTHVAGTAVADGRTGNIAGVSWDNPIMPIRVMDTDFIITSAYTIEGIFHIVDYMEENDARVVANYSIGGRGYDAAMKDALDYAMDKGLIWVAAAGNDSKRVPSLPATYNGLISVAASTPRNEKADFSTTGFWNSVAAPGVQTWSTYLNEDYQSLQGTSMAAPHVAGAAALLLSENPDLTSVEVLNQIEQTAQGDRFTEELGHGILDVEAMLGSIRRLEYGSLLVNTDTEGSKLTVFDSAGNLVSFAAVGSALERKFHALSEGSYQINLSYTDNETGESRTLSEDVIISADSITELDLMLE